MARRDEVASDSPVHGWYCDETSGTSLSPSYGSASLILDSAASLNGANLANGCGTSLQLETNNKAYQYSGIGFDMTQSFSFDCLINLDSSSSYSTRYIVVLVGSRNYRLRAYVNGGNVSFIFSNQLEDNTITEAVYSQDVTYNLGFRYERTGPLEIRVSIFIDGVEANYVQNPIRSVNSDTAGIVTFGGTDFNLYVRTLIDEMHFYDTALSDERFAAHAGLGGVPDEYLTPAATIYVKKNEILAAIASAARVKTVPVIKPFARARVLKPEAVTASAVIRVAPGVFSPGAIIRVERTETLAAPTAACQVISLAPGTLANATRHWRLVVKYNGFDVTSRVFGVVSIDQEENASAIARFRFRATTGALDPIAYVGGPVEITFYDLAADGSTNYASKRFAGVVSDVSVDPQTSTLDITCTTDLQSAANALSRTQIDSLVGGTWSPAVFDPGAQGFDYLVDQLDTVQASLWHSPSGIVRTDWAPGSPFVTLTEADIYSRSLIFLPANRNDLVNRLSVGFDYRFARKRQRTLKVSWKTSIPWCAMLLNGVTHCQRTMVEAAADGGAWTLQGGITFDPLPVSQAFRCVTHTGGTVTIGWVAGAAQEALCKGANWTAAARWQQMVTEYHAITIEAPESVAKNGAVPQAESYALQCTDDISQWVEADAFDGPGAGFSGVGGNVVSGGYTLGDVALDATDDPNTGRAAADAARQCLIDYGIARIASAHRANTVTCDTRFYPALDLTRTVRINTAHLAATGKVRRLVDRFDIDTGQAKTRVYLAISRQGGTGSVTTTPTVADSAPTPTAESGIPTRLDLQTRVGGLATSVPYNEDWTGYTTNYQYDPNDPNPFADDPDNPNTNVYPVKFAVEYPEITGAAVEAIELPASQTVSIEIRNDELTLARP